MDITPTTHIAQELFDAHNKLEFKKKLIVQRAESLGYTHDQFSVMFDKKHNVSHGTYSVASFLDDSAEPSQPRSKAQLKRDAERRAVRVVKHFGGKHTTTYYSDGTSCNVYEDGYRPASQYVVKTDTNE